MLEIQKLVKSHNNIVLANDALKRDLGIDTRREQIKLSSGIVETVYIYNCDWDASMDSPICVEADGLILSIKGDIVSMSLPHIPHQYEKGIEEMDWLSAYAEEFLDGTRVTVYTLNNECFIQTKKYATASNKTPHKFSNLTNGHLLFSELVETILMDKIGEHCFKPFIAQHCYVFELTSLYNRKISRYTEPELTLLAITNKTTGSELSRYAVDTFAEKNKLRRPKMIPITGLSAMTYLMEEIHPTNKGFIISDGKGNRVKLQNDSFTELEKLVKPNHMKMVSDWARIVVRGKYGNIKSYFPEYEGIIDLFFMTMLELVEEANEIWKEHGPKDEEEFIEKTKDCSLFFPLLLLKKGKVKSIAEAVEGLNPKILADEVNQRKWSELRRIQNSL